MNRPILICLLLASCAAAEATERRPAVGHARAESRPIIVWACKIIRRAPVMVRVCKPTLEDRS